MTENKIKILPENLANKIAAGEVVQRPESVLKELMENSIDASAKNIEVIIKRAGKSLIQVIDDGSGMSEEDVMISILKHATSKINSLEDLEAIQTLGFRGEALSSITAVSQVEIKTETNEDEIGTLIRIDDSSQIVKEKGSFPKGTSIAVKNLFYNTPARRNFLKTDGTELKHLTDTFNKIALSNNNISFKYYLEDDLIYNYSAGTLEERIQQVFTDNGNRPSGMLDALLHVEEKTDFISVYGFIGKPSLLKKSKGEQYLFINNRYVQSKQINHAVFSAYENILEKGDYPFFVLFIELDPRRIDVNIHPSKLEVRFEDDRDIYKFVFAVIKKSLGTYDLVPSMSFSEHEVTTEKISFNPFNKIEKKDFSDRPVFNKKIESETRLSNNEIDMLFGSLSGLIKNETPLISPFEQTENKEFVHRSSTNKEEAGNDSPFIVQLHNKYILSQIKTGLMIIDQHVAHERILYEKAIKRFESDLPFSQQLIFPLTLQLDPGYFLLAKEIEEYLIKLGFEFKIFGKNTIVIEGVPDDIKKGTEEETFLGILYEFQFNQREKKLTDTLDNIAKSYSCRTAIKAGDKLSEKEIRILIDELFATSMPYVCPHGRPIVIKISLDEFDRRFGRTS